MHDHACDVIGKIAFDLFDIDGGLLHTLIHELPGGFTTKGNLAGHHFIKDDSERIDIGATVDALAFHLFGRHIARSADNSARAGHAHLRGFERSGEAEIGDVDLIVLADKNVVRLEVTMDDAFGVSSVERFAKLANDFERATRAKAGLLP